MASQNDVGFVPFFVDATYTPGISAFTVVDLQADGSIQPANAIQGIGVIQEDVPAGYYGNVKLWTAPGTFNILLAAGSPSTPGSNYAINASGQATSTATPANAILRSISIDPDPTPGTLVSEFIPLVNG